jgi:hypothetical protein
MGNAFKTLPLKVAPPRAYKANITILIPTTLKLEGDILSSSIVI